MTIPNSAGMPDMQKYVVSFQEDGHRNGLGVVVGTQVISAAHVIPISPRDRMAWIEMEAVDYAGGRAAPVVQSMDCTFDFVVLGSEPIDWGNEDIELRTFEEIEPWIKPASLIFPEGEDTVTFDAYLFAPDGKTRIDTLVIAHRNSTRLTLETQQATHGCSGGPLFTEAENALVGIVQSVATVWETGEQHECIAVRIDLAATEWFRREQGGFDTVHLRPTR